MTDTTRVPLHRLELASGVYRITTTTAVYEICVTEKGLQKTGIHEVQQRDYITADPDNSAKPIIIEDSYYREISEEMLREIGRLARQLSISIKTPVNESAVKSVDLKKAGIDLETAKSQLQDIVDMTEKATMTIMDISDGIQESCDTIRKNLEEITGLGFVMPEKMMKKPSRSVRDIMSNIKEREEQLKAILESVADGFSGPQAGAAAQGMDSALAILGKSLECLNGEIETVKDVYCGAGDDYSIIRREDHDKLVKAVSSTDNVIHQIISNLNRILESLSFQDLSGQRIMRILAMLSDVQVQLLSILVSYGVKLRKKQELREVSAKDTNELASKEVERIKSIITEEHGEGNRLDQDAVDKLLADLGF